MNTKQGTRNFYVIISYGNYDGLSGDVRYITQNRQEAIRYFRFLYSLYERDYTNDEGEIWAENDFNIDISKPILRGCFWFNDEDGCSEVKLTTINTNKSYSWGSYNKGLDSMFSDWNRE